MDKQSHCGEELQELLEAFEKEFVQKTAEESDREQEEKK